MTEHELIHVNRNIADLIRKIKALCEDMSEWYSIESMIAGETPVNKMRILRGQYSALAARALQVDEVQTPDGIMLSYGYRGEMVNDEIPY